MTEWTGLVENVQELKQIIGSNYELHKALIKYLDNESMLQ